MSGYYCRAFAARYEAGGTPLASFGAGGLIAGLPGYAVLPGPGGGIYVGGRGLSGEPTGGDFTLRRLTAVAGPDPSFGDVGGVATDFKLGNDVPWVASAVPGGGLLLAGTSYGYGDPDATVRLAIARYETSPGRADADADGRRDRRDRCPSRFGRRHGGCPTVGRRLPFIVWNPPLIEGTMETKAPSRAQQCSSRKPVRILRERPGRDAAIVRTRTNKQGEWSIRAPARRAGLYALAPRRTVPVLGRCRIARSRVLQNG